MGTEVRFRKQLKDQKHSLFNLIQPVLSTVKI